MKTYIVIFVALVGFQLHAEDEGSQSSPVQGLLQAQNSQEAQPGDAIILCETGSQRVSAIDLLNQRIAEKKLTLKNGFGMRTFERPFTVSSPAFSDPKFSSDNERVCVTITKK